MMDNNDTPAAIRDAGQTIATAIRDGAQAIVYAIRGHACAENGWEDARDFFREAERTLAGLNGKPSELRKKG